MKVKAWGVSFLLLAASLGCHREEKSQVRTVKPVQTELKDEFANALRSIDIQDGSGQGPSACVVDKEGALACYSSGAYSPHFAAFRNLGPLRDLHENCAVNQYGSMSCVLPANQQKVRAPLMTENIQSVNFAGVNEPCVLLKTSKGAYVKCYGDENPLGEMLFNSRTVQSPGTSLAEINPVVAYAQTRINGTGDRLACGLLASGTASCKNITKQGDEVDRQSDSVYVSLALNHELKCLVDTKGNLTCETHSGQPAVYPPGIKTSKVLEVSGHDRTMCLRYENGQLNCWNGSRAIQRSDFGVTQKVVKVEANRFGICALFADDRLLCLEPNDLTLVAYSELKGDNLVTNNDPTDPQTCVTGSGGKLACWGGLANPEIPKNRSYPKSGDLALGLHHFCSREDGVVRCEGQTVPASLNGVSIAKLVAAQNHSCGLSTTGAVFCWGQDLLGETRVPIDLPPIKVLATATNASCAIDTSNSLHCWGKSNLTSIPSDIGAVKEVALGLNHVCALTLNGQPRCWGDAADGKTIPFTAPNGFKNLVAGPNHSCALNVVDGTPSCWGNNELGQTEVPVSLQKVKALALGPNHSCAINEKNKVVCWGDKRAIDMQNRFEKGNGLVPMKYLGDIFRLPADSQDLEVCANGVCQLPEEPVVSFDGANISYNPRQSFYSFWLHYASSCPDSRLALILNGRYLPEKIDATSGGREAGPQDMERLAKFYQAPIDPKTVTQGTLNGPALLQMRVINPDGSYTRNLPQGCHVRVKVPALQLSDNTLLDWEDRAGDLVSDLKTAIDGYLNYKRVTGGLQNAWISNALALHDILLNSFVEQVKNAVDAARIAGALADEVPADIEEDGLRDLLMSKDQLPVVLGGDSVELHDSYAPLSPPPDWYYPATWSVSWNEQSNLENTLTAYISTRSMLTAPFDSDATGNMRRQAMALGLASVNRDLKKARTFIRTAETLREQIQALSSTTVESIVKALQGSVKSANANIQSK